MKEFTVITKVGEYLIKADDLIFLGMWVHFLQKSEGEEPEPIARFRDDEVIGIIIGDEKSPC